MQNLTPPNSSQLAVIEELEESLNIEIPQVEVRLAFGSFFMTNSNGQIIDLSLSRSGAKTEDLEIVGKLLNLKYLSLGKNQITEIKSLDNLTNLESLGLDNNYITEIKGLENLVSLEQLYLFNNKITKIKGLDNLVNLKGIYLHGNKIPGIKSFLKINHLENIQNKNSQYNFNLMYSILRTLTCCYYIIWVYNGLIANTTMIFNIISSIFNGSFRWETLGNFILGLIIAIIFQLPIITLILFVEGFQSHSQKTRQESALIIRKTTGFRNYCFIAQAVLSAYAISLSMSNQLLLITNITIGLIIVAYMIWFYRKYPNADVSIPVSNSKIHGHICVILIIVLIFMLLGQIANFIFIQILSSINNKF